MELSSSALLHTTQQCQHRRQQQQIFHHFFLSHTHLAVTYSDGNVGMMEFYSTRHNTMTSTPIPTAAIFHPFLLSPRRHILRRKCGHDGVEQQRALVAHAQDLDQRLFRGLVRDALENPVQRRAVQVEVRRELCGGVGRGKVEEEEEEEQNWFMQ